MEGSAARRRIESIDAYIATFPKDVQRKLQELREVIREEAPGAEEAISYGMPTFKLHGNLVHFAAYEGHIGFYPTPSAMAAFEDRLSPYKRSKGAVQFPIDRPIPLDIVREMVRFRVRESQAVGEKGRRGRA
jgi:uncharacterized protein YdhG (YjbR/CyaY superfamily)